MSGSTHSGAPLASGIPLEGSDDVHVEFLMTGPDLSFAATRLKAIIKKVCGPHDEVGSWVDLSGADVWGFGQPAQWLSVRQKSPNRPLDGPHERALGEFFERPFHGLAACLYYGHHLESIRFLLKDGNGPVERMLVDWSFLETAWQVAQEDLVPPAPGQSLAARAVPFFLSESQTVARYKTQAHAHHLVKALPPAPSYPRPQRF